MLAELSNDERADLVVDTLGEFLVDVPIRSNCPS